MSLLRPRLKMLLINSSSQEEDEYIKDNVFEKTENSFKTLYQLITDERGRCGIGK